MVEMTSVRKHKINLSDYNYQRDIENRLLMSQFSLLDLEILEEILFSSLNIPIRKLAKNVGVSESEALPTLEKLSRGGLLRIQGDTAIVDKEMRKYFEAQMQKFDEEFTPGMEFLQGLLRKVPIHVLPTWYAIPRTSNNIFDSLVEKYLLTPQIFQRYLIEIPFPSPTLAGIVRDVHQAPDFKVPAAVLMSKYSLTKEQFEEHLLYLEFHFVCCLGYSKVKDSWEEVVTPFHEWREYLRFLRDTTPQPISDAQRIQRTRPHDFSFILDMAALLALAKKQPIPLTSLQALPDKTVQTLFGNAAYAHQVLAKLRQLKLADVIDGRLYALETANDWLEMRLEDRALFLYRHPLNRLLAPGIPAHLCHDRNIRESEKSVQRVLQMGWVYTDAFLNSALVPLSDGSAVVLKRMGKTWRYAPPEYTDEEKALIKAVICEWLFEIGAVSTGSLDGRECFCVTPFGQSLFGR
jgi:DNA-binding Lrp family transcriptional regulator